MRAVLLALVLLVTLAWLVLDVADRAGAEWARDAKRVVMSWLGVVAGFVIGASLLLGWPWWLAASIAVAALVLTPAGRLITGLALMGGRGEAGALAHTDAPTDLLCAGHEVPGYSILRENGATVGWVGPTVDGAVSMGGCWS